MKTPGALAQLIRALLWHSRGHEFESHTLHHTRGIGVGRLFFVTLALINPVDSQYLNSLEANRGNFT